MKPLPTMHLTRDVCSGAHAWRGGECRKCGEKEPTFRFDQRRAVKLTPNAVIEVRHIYLGDTYSASVDAGKLVMFYRNGMLAGRGQWTRGELRLEEAGRYPCPREARLGLEAALFAELERRVFGF